MCSKSLLKYSILSKNIILTLKTFFVQKNTYSNLRASIGFIFEAFQAGNNQNTIHIKTDTQEANITTFRFITALKSQGAYLFIK